jgi:hypothetical protein
MRTNVGRFWGFIYAGTRQQTLRTSCWFWVSGQFPV